MMSDVRLLDQQERRTSLIHQDGAHDLARRLPNLIVAAKDVASSVMHGVHGRRRAGIGETFWQFRPFVTGESATAIDWRRSARDDRLYIREREWEAAHTVFVWMDRSPSMAFVSKLAQQSKLDRGLVLGLAAADLLVRGGERVGILGLTRPLATRNIIEVFAETLLAEERKANFVAPELPPKIALDARTQAILFSDFLSDPATIAQVLQRLSAHGAAGHLVMIVDPVEETFPFTGHTEFVDVDSAATLRVGSAEIFRDDYLSRLAAHRNALREAAQKCGFSFLLHRSDRPASEALLALHMRLEAASSATRPG